MMYVLYTDYLLTRSRIPDKVVRSRVPMPTGVRVLKSRLYLADGNGTLLEEFRYSATYSVVNADGRQAIENVRKIALSG